MEGLVKRAALCSACCVHHDAFHERDAEAAHERARVAFPLLIGADTAGLEVGAGAGAGAEDFLALPPPAHPLFFFGGARTRLQNRGKAKEKLNPHT